MIILIIITMTTWQIEEKINEQLNFTAEINFLKKRNDTWSIFVEFKELTFTEFIKYFNDFINIISCYPIITSFSIEIDLLQVYDDDDLVINLLPYNVEEFDIVISKTYSYQGHDSNIILSCVSCINLKKI